MRKSYFLIMADMTFVTLFVTTSMVSAAELDIAEISGFLHIDGALSMTADNSSSSFTSALDVSNLGSYGWTFTNSSSAVWKGVSFLAFLDADVDRTVNTFLNEIGECVDLSLPSGAPSGAIAATSWEIDEPGYLFGDIYANLYDGMLDNTNAVGRGMPDDVSMALGFYLGDLAPGETADITLFTSLSNIGGLRHEDPASGYAFYYNGYATVTGRDIDPPQPVPVPEPSTIVLMTLGLLVGQVLARRMRRG